MRSFMVALAGICCFLNSAYGDCSWGGTLNSDLSTWVLGTNQPTIRTGLRGDGTIGEYVHIPVGTSPFFNESEYEGQGSLTFWINDPGNCLDNPNPGYPNNGPMWGLITSDYEVVTMGIWRANYLYGCQGYFAWSSCEPTVRKPFNDGLRASYDHAYTPGWYKWTLTGSWDDITFTLHDVTYEIQDGSPHDDDTFGDCSVTYDATTLDGTWEYVFGDGWNGLYMKGDANHGIEDIDLQIVSTSGIFDILCADEPSSPTYSPSRLDTTVAGMHYTGTIPGTDASYLVQLLDYPSGMALDSINTLHWNPTMANIGNHLVTADVIGMGSSFTSSVHITVSESLSTSHIIKTTNKTVTDLKLSGNPFRNVITVTLPNTIRRIDICATNGTIIHSTRPRTARFTWGAGAPAGVYTLRATTDAGTYVKSIVKYGK